MTKSRRLLQARDRQLLRDLAQLVERADPEMLAGLVTEIDSTLRSCTKIEAFFKTYVMALSRRRAH
jgi:hypothetical protein